MISYRYSPPNAKPTHETYVRYDDVTDRFYFREYDEGTVCTRTGIVDRADLPEAIADMAQKVAAHITQKSKYIFWKRGPASIFKDGTDV